MPQHPGLLARNSALFPDWDIANFRFGRSTRIVWLRLLHYRLAEQVLALTSAEPRTGSRLQNLRTCRTLPISQTSPKMWRYLGERQSKEFLVDQCFALSTISLHTGGGRVQFEQNQTPSAWAVPGTPRPCKGPPHVRMTNTLFVRHLIASCC